MASGETFLVRGGRLIGNMFKRSIDQGNASEMLIACSDYKLKIGGAS